MFANGLRNEANTTETFNGAKTHRSTRSFVLDLYGMGGALRSRNESEIKDLVLRAANEDLLLTLRTLFYLRDVRGGQGERRTFRVGLMALASEFPKAVKANLPNIPEFGRYDDLIAMFDSPLRDEAGAILKATFNADRTAEKPTLLGKWLPSENTSSKSTRKSAKAIRSLFKMSPKTYRKSLSDLRSKINIVEKLMCQKRFNDIVYKSVPSKAMLKFRKSFSKRDGERFTQYLADVKSGKSVIKSGTLFPYDIVRPMLSGSTDESLELQWKALPNYMAGGNTLVVADTSESMYNSGYYRGRNDQVSPIAVALSLAIYTAERNVGAYKDLLLIFSDDCHAVELTSPTLAGKVKEVLSATKGYSTNIQAMFDKVLQIAVQKGATQSEIPETILIISDMEFNCVSGGSELTNFEAARVKFAKHGYQLPDVVFWNVNSAKDQLPVKKDDKGAFLVSGASPSILSAVLDSEKRSRTSYDLMLEVLNSERYAKIIV